MDALTVVLGAGIGIVLVAIIGLLVVLTRRGDPAEELWPGDEPAPAPELEPFWQREAATATRPLPPSTAKVALDDEARAALVAWQDAEGDLLDRWLDRHEARLREIAAAADRAAAYQAVLTQMSAKEERLVHEAIERAPDDELRTLLSAMHRGAVDALVEAASGDIAASSRSYAAYVRARTHAEVRMAALEPA